MAPGCPRCLDAPALSLAIEVKDLRKVYRGGVEALRGVDLEVPKGCCFGLLGPNGAGKSTLIKVLLSIVRPTSGHATLLGKDIALAEAREGVGYLPENHRFPKYLTARGVCEYFGGLSGLSGPKLKKEIDEKLAWVGMTDWDKTKVSKFSKGMAQRVGVAQALLGKPKMVFLDEPTDGVDPMAREGLRNTIKQVTEAGTTVFVNSHLLSEIELMCDRVAILNQGQVMQAGTVAEVTSAVSGDALRVRFRTAELPKKVWKSLSKRGAKREPDSCFVIEVDDDEAISKLIDELRAEDVSIYAVTPERKRLEEAFLELIRAEGGDGSVVMNR